MTSCKLATSASKFLAETGRTITPPRSTKRSARLAHLCSMSLESSNHQAYRSLAFASRTRFEQPRIIRRIVIHHHPLRRVEALDQQTARIVCRVVDRPDNLGPPTATQPIGSRTQERLGHVGVVNALRTCRSSRGWCRAAGCSWDRRSPAPGPRAAHSERPETVLPRRARRRDACADR